MSKRLADDLKAGDRIVYPRLLDGEHVVKRVTGSGAQRIIVFEGGQSLGIPRNEEVTVVSDEDDA